MLLTIRPGAQLSPYFNSDELIRAGAEIGSTIESDLLSLAELVRFWSGSEPVFVSSFFRPGDPKEHGKRNALDLALSPKQLNTLHENFSYFLYDSEKYGLRGFGNYRSHVHIDRGTLGTVDHFGSGYPIRYWTGENVDKWRVNNKLQMLNFSPFVIALLAIVYALYSKEIKRLFKK